jgi:hypothetical protein
MFAVDVAGLTAGTQYDRLDATGTVELGGATLAPSVTFAAQAGDAFMIIANDDADAITGTFDGLAEGATLTLGGQVFAISYVGGDGNDVVLTAQTSVAGLIVSGAAPVDVLASQDVTTIRATNTVSDTVSIARTHRFDDDITATVNAGVTVGGSGLKLETTKDAGTITVANDGAIVLDDATLNWEAALFIQGHGGLVHYAGSGDIRNDPFSSAMFIDNAGDIAVEIGGGTIAGGIELNATGGAVTLTMTGGQVGSATAPVSGSGISAFSQDADGEAISVTAQAIHANGTGIAASNRNGDADIIITANGAISAATGISAWVSGSGSKGGKGGKDDKDDGKGDDDSSVTAQGDITITANGAISAEFTGIGASLGGGKGGAAEGDITVTANAAITVTDGDGIGVFNSKSGGGDATITADAITAAFSGISVSVIGIATVTANGAITATAGDGINAGAGKDVTVTVNADVTAGQRGVAVAGDTAQVEIGAGAIVKGATGVQAFGASTVVTAGTVEGTGGTAIAFEAGSSNRLELETTAQIIGNVIGGGSDTLVLCGGASASGTFDLDQIVSGFTQIVKEAASTWTLSGTLAVATTLNEACCGSTARCSATSRSAAP